MSRHDRGVLGMRARWGPPRLARLDGLTEEERTLILDLIDAFQHRPDDALVRMLRRDGRSSRWP
jgi:hypothetical protein